MQQVVKAVDEQGQQSKKSTYSDPSGVECAFVKRTARTPEMALAIVNPVHVSSSSSSSLFIIFNPDTQFPGNEKNYAVQYNKVQKSSWNEPYSSSSFTNSHAVRWHCMIVYR